MKTVRILEDFEGWPTGKAPVRYAKGEEVKVSNAFADLIVGKGHAETVDDDHQPDNDAEPAAAGEQKDNDA